MKLRSLIVVGVFLAGCATQPPPGSNEPKSESNYNHDLYECTREATFADIGTKQQVFDNCMKAKGYRPKAPTDR
jgi:hypothetical protein